MVSELKNVKRYGKLGMLLAAVSILLTVQAYAAGAFVRRPDPSGRYAANQVLITLKSGHTAADLAALNSCYGSSVARRLSGTNTYVLNLSGAGVPSESLIANEAGILSKYSAVSDIQFNHIYRPLASVLPNDEYFAAYYDVTNLLYGQWQFQPDPVDPTIEHIHMPEAWELEKGSSEVIVAVLDTGVRTTTVLDDTGATIRKPHPDLVNRLILDPAYVFDSNGNLIPPDTAMWDMDPSPPEGDAEVGWVHGTMCSGLIAAETDNTIGMAGLCWSGVRILPVKLADEDANLYDDAIFEGLEYVIRYRDTELSSTGDPLRVNVVNMSFGGPTWNSLLLMQIRRAAASGIVLVAAAGNSWEQGAYPPGYPAALDDVICVGSTDSRDIVSTYSQRGRTLDLVAPGEDILSTAWSKALSTGDANTDPGGGGGPVTPPGSQSLGISPQAITSSTFPDSCGNYIAEFKSGTSFAAPIVTAAAAMLISHGVPASDVKQMLTSTATPIGFGRPNDTYGWGILNMRKALEKASIEVQIQAPAKSSIVTNSRPRFRIDFRHADKTTIEVTLDGQPLIGGTGALIQEWDQFYYTLDAAAGKTYLLFDYPVAPGSHTLTASAVSDWDFVEAPPEVPIAEDTGRFIVRANALNTGWHMFSVPYILDSSILPETVIGSSAQLWRYAYADSDFASYAAYSAGGRMDLEATFGPPSVKGNVLVHPTDGTSATPPAGLGYWLKVRGNGLALDLTRIPEDKISEVGSAPYAIGLYKGWNMVGCPYVAPTPWQSALFDFGGIRLTAQEAVEQGWISSYIYSYDAFRQVYTTAPISSAVMQPWQAQWVRVKVDSAQNAQIFNGSFQGGFTSAAGALDCTGSVGVNWSPFTFGLNVNELDPPAGSFSSGSPGLSDSLSQRIAPSGANEIHSGIYQHYDPLNADDPRNPMVAVVPGERYSFSAWTKRLGVWPAGEGTQVGIDPTGGVDPEALSVIWSGPIERAVGQWTQQVAYATAESSLITVFVRVVANSPGEDRAVYIDDAKISGGHDVTLIVNPGYTANPL